MTEFYDDDAAVKFIKNQLPQEMKETVSNDQVNYVIDIIYDFYDNKGFMNDDESEDIIIEIDENEVVDYVYKSLVKDKVLKLSKEEVTFIIQGEFSYCESLGLFEA